MDQQKHLFRNQQKQSLYHQNNSINISAQQHKQASFKENIELQRIYSKVEAVRRQFEGFEKCVGLLRTNWYSDRHKLKAISYGTAFALRKNLIMTCGHNLYSETHKTLASEIIFYPCINFDNTNPKSLKCTNSTQIKLSYPKPSYSYLPTKEELTIFHLDQENELQTDGFLKIGQLDSKDKGYGQKISMVGYPSTEYYNLQQMNDSFYQKIKRTALEGQVLSIKRHIINHTMATSIGFSGSPIMSTNSEGELQIIGIHTHKGLQSKYNSGLYFNKEVLGIFYRFTTQLRIREPYLMMKNTNYELCTKQIENESQKQSSSPQKQNPQTMPQNQNCQIMWSQQKFYQSSFILGYHQQDFDNDSILLRLILDDSIEQPIEDYFQSTFDQSQLNQSSFQIVSMGSNSKLEQQSYGADDNIKQQISLIQNILEGQYQQIAKYTQIFFHLSKRDQSIFDIDKISNQDISTQNNSLQSNQDTFDQFHETIKANM